MSHSNIDFFRIFKKETTKNGVFYVADINQVHTWDVPIKIKHKVVRTYVQAGSDNFNQIKKQYLDDYYKANDKLFSIFHEFCENNKISDLIETKKIEEIKKSISPIKITIVNINNINSRKAVINQIKSNSKVKKIESEEIENEQYKKYIDELLYNYSFTEEYPVARSMKRKIYFYAGETNSGKTYHALNKLSESKSGIYLGPLRLLALEGKEEIEKRGKPCSLITGEEKVYEKNAFFISSTIEMLDTHKKVDTTVIDEIQMVNDDSRGWAWVKALIGAPSETVILTGAPSAIPLVSYICSLLNEELEIIKLERKTELKISKHIFDYKDIPEKTAIIAFSKRDVLKIKNELKKYGIKSSIIFGGLTPEVRKNEAKKFKEGKTKVVISTDAIAMGLNLPIDYVIFSTISKFNGKEYTLADDMLIRQIAGRAGRYGFSSCGYVGAMHQRDIEDIEVALKSPIEEDFSLYVKPTLKMIYDISERINSKNFVKILRAYQKSQMQIQKPFFSVEIEPMIKLSKHVESFSGFSFEEKYTLINAPINIEEGIVISDSEEVYKFFIKYIKKQKESYNEERHKNLIQKIHKTSKIGNINTIEDFHKLEHALNCLDLYLWFSNHKPEFFQEKEYILNLKNNLNKNVMFRLDKDKKFKI